MRVISQDGRIDLPYEQIAVVNNDADEMMIIAYAVNSDDDTIWNLAEYSTKEKAKKAMEELRMECLGYRVVRGKTFYFAFDYPKLFRFPQDSDV